MNIMLAAVLAEGMTVIENAAKEPHIVDLANFLNSMGADIMGAGTDVIKIRGVERLRGGSYSIIPDQIEAGTYMAAVAAAGGDVLIQNVIPKHLDCITAKLVEMGVEVEELDDAVRVRRSGPISRANVKTMPYPGFPTDMQPQIAAVLCLARGTSVLTEGVWDNRYRYVDEFRRMGAHIQVDGKVAVIEGVDRPHWGPGPRLRPAGGRRHGGGRPGRPGGHRGGRHPPHRAGVRGPGGQAGRRGRRHPHHHRPRRGRQGPGGISRSAEVER